MRPRTSSALYSPPARSKVRGSLRSALASSLLLPGTSAWNSTRKPGGTCADERALPPSITTPSRKLRFRLGLLSSPDSAAKKVTSRGSLPWLVISKTAQASVLSSPVSYEVPRNGSAVARWRMAMSPWLQSVTTMGKQPSSSDCRALPAVPIGTAWPSSYSPKAMVLVR